MVPPVDSAAAARASDDDGLVVEDVDATVVVVSTEGVVVAGPALGDGPTSTCVSTIDPSGNLSAFVIFANDIPFSTLLCTALFCCCVV